MAQYNDLKTDRYYLIKEAGAQNILMVYVLMETEKAVFLELEDGAESLVWRKKSDTLEEIVEELTEEQADLYESIIYEEEDEEDDFSWEGLDTEEDDEEEEDGDEDDDDAGGKTRRLFK